jgi:branched-chain amino acid transport system ATP-binding protein
MNQMSATRDAEMTAGPVGPAADLRPALLEVQSLEAGYGDVQVLWGVSLAVAQGGMTTLIGANGAGKTTTLRAIMGSIAPRGGRVVFAGEDVTALPPHAKAARGLVLVPEGRQLFAEMSVEENLEMGAYSARARRRAAERLEQVYTLFPRLKERRRQRAGTFSGGEQQMLAIGRGLMCDPQLLIIDELSLGLAPVVVQMLLHKLSALKDTGLTILLVEQNVHLALALSDYAYVIAEGRPFAEGPSQKIAARAEIRRAYLGL